MSINSYYRPKPIHGKTVYGQAHHVRLRKVLEPVAVCGGPFFYYTNNSSTEHLIWQQWKI